MATQTYAGLQNEQKTFYERVLLERLTPNLLYQKYGQKKPMPRNQGDKVNFRRFDSFATATTPLTEGVTPAGQTLTISKVDATVAQYGDFVEISDKLDMLGIDPVLTEVSKMFGEQAGRTIDELVRDEVTAGTNVFWANGKGSREALTAADVLTVEDIKKASYILRKNDAKPCDGKFYVGIFSTEQVADLMSDPDWKEYAIQASPELYTTGEAGNLFGIKILSTTTVPTVTIEGGVKVQLGVIIGRDAYGVVDVDGSSKPEMIVKPHGSSGASDPLNQRATSAWKAMLAAKRLNELAMVRLETGTSLLA